MMNASPTISAAPAHRRRWRTKHLAIALALFVLSASGVVVVLWFLAANDLDAAIAEADRLDPGWRFEELEARRANIADADNAALRVLAAHKLLPAVWRRVDIEKSAWDLPACALLTAAQAHALAEARTAAASSLAEARKLKDLPRGRYPIIRDAQGLPLPTVLPEQEIALLLYYDILLRGNDADIDGALESCRSYLNAARAYGDAPDHVMQERRIETRTRACRVLGRTLALGEACEASLAAVQKLLEEEEQEPVFLHGARGLRASLDSMLEGIQEKRITSTVPSLVTAGFAVNVRPATLRMTTRLAEVAKRPIEQQRQALDQGGSPKANEGPFLGRVYILPKIQVVEHRLSHGQICSQAELRCAMVAVAAERYRLEHGRWPATAAALVPAYLHAVPTDPFDRQPVRYRELPDGLVIYCLGPDCRDDGGNLDRRLTAPPGTDLGVRLWNVAQRRQPPPAQN